MTETAAGKGVLPEEEVLALVEKINSCVTKYAEAEVALPVGILFDGDIDPSTAASSTRGSEADAADSAAAPKHRPWLLLASLNEAISPKIISKTEENEEIMSQLPYFEPVTHVFSTIESSVFQMIQMQGKMKRLLAGMDADDEARAKIHREWPAPEDLDDDDDPGAASADKEARVVKLFYKNNMGEEFADSGYRGLTSEDEENYPMLEKHWTEWKDFVTAALGGNLPEPGNVSDTSHVSILIHCAQGMNRSGVLTCAWVHWWKRAILKKTGEDWSLLDTVEWCARKRGKILWNTTFQRQLVEWAAREGIL